MVKPKLIGLFRLFRFELPFAAGVCVIVGELLALGRFPSIIDLLFGFLSVFFLSAAALILNDYFDVETDRINAPHRPIPSGQVSRLDALILFVIVTLIGLGLSAFLGVLALIVSFLVWLVGVLYNSKFKKSGLLGNLMVSFSVGMTFVFGGIVVRQFSEFVFWYFAIITTLIDLGEEIVADAMDSEGDHHAGSRSLAIIYGKENAIRIGSSVFLFIIVFTLTPILFHWISLIYLLPIIILDGFLLFSTIKLLNRQTKNRRYFIRMIYTSGLVALILLVIIRIFFRFSS